jgi:hypothetical protein
MKKVFRNEMDYWHFFGPFFAFGATGFFLHPAFYLVGCLTVFLWEVWDMYKDSYQDGLDSGYNWYQLMFLTSDGIFDPHDMFLGFGAISLWMVADTIYFFVG